MNRVNAVALFLASFCSLAMRLGLLYATFFIWMPPVYLDGGIVFLSCMLLTFFAINLGIGTLILRLDKKKIKLITSMFIY